MMLANPPTETVVEDTTPRTCEGWTWADSVVADLILHSCAPVLFSGGPLRECAGVSGPPLLRSVPPFGAPARCELWSLALAPALGTRFAALAAFPEVLCWAADRQLRAVCFRASIRLEEQALPSLPPLPPFLSPGGAKSLQIRPSVWIYKAFLDLLDLLDFLGSIGF